MRVVDGIVIAVAGAKGGVGTTTTSINLCAVLAALNYDVVLVETDLAMANIGDYLELGVPLDDEQTPTFHEVLAGRAHLSDATYGAPGGFDVVPCGRSLEGFANADVGAVADAVETARATHEVVVLDTGTGVDAAAICPLGLADETVLVSAPNVASVRGAVKTCEIVEHVDGTVAGVVFVGSVGEQSPSVDEIASFLSLDLLGHVPEDRAVIDAEEARRPVVTVHPDSAATTGYTALGASVRDRIAPLRAERAITLGLVDRPLEVANTDAPAVQNRSLEAGPEPLSAEDDDEPAVPADPETGGFEFGVDPVEATADGAVSASDSPTETRPVKPSVADGQPVADGVVDVAVHLTDRASAEQRSDDPPSRRGDEVIETAPEPATDEPIAVTGTDVGAAGGDEPEAEEEEGADAAVEFDGSNTAKEALEGSAEIETETKTERGVLGRALGIVSRRNG